MVWNTCSVRRPQSATMADFPASPCRSRAWAVAAMALPRTSSGLSSPAGPRRHPGRFFPPDKRAGGPPALSGSGPVRRPRRRSWARRGPFPSGSPWTGPRPAHSRRWRKWTRPPGSPWPHPGRIPERLQSAPLPSGSLFAGRIPAGPWQIPGAEFLSRSGPLRPWQCPGPAFPRKRSGVRRSLGSLTGFDRLSGSAIPGPRGRRPGRKRFRCP